jgi:large subunit ribosomal protein L23
MKTPYDVLIKPVLSEKAYAQFASGTYTFWVHPSSNRTEIANAVEQAFKVKVVRVNVQNTLGKDKRLGRFMGKRPDRKKAIVTVAAGQKIEALEGLI